MQRFHDGFSVRCTSLKDMVSGGPRVLYQLWFNIHCFVGDGPSEVGPLQKTATKVILPEPLSRRCGRNASIHAWDFEASAVDGFMGLHMMSEALPWWSSSLAEAKVSHKIH